MNKAAAISSSNVWYVNIRKGFGYYSGLQYQLEYGGQITRCIGVEAATYGAISSLQSLLFELPFIKQIGVLVDLVEESNESRIYKISFLYPGKFPLNLYFEDANGLCPTPAGPAFVSIHTSVTSTYRYVIKSEASLVLKVVAAIPAGSYVINIAPENAISVSPWGISSNSMKLRVYDGSENLLYQRAIRSTGILRSSYSSLYFSSSVPGEASDLTVMICLQKKLSYGDVFTVYLANFTDMGGFAYTSSTNSYIVWNSLTKQLSFDIRDKSNSSNCLVEDVPQKYGLKLPRVIITQSSYTYTFTVVSAVGVIYNSKFKIQSSIGFLHSSIDIIDKLPGFNTSLNVKFTLLCPLTNESVVLSLPSFKRTSVTLKYVSLLGPFQHVIPIGIWHDYASQLWISPNATLPPGDYSIFIDGSQGLSVNPDGLSRTSYPSLTMTQNGILVPPAAFSEYPLVLGFKDSYLVLSVSRPSNVLSGLSFAATFGYAASGSRLNISIYLPCLSSTFNYLSWDIGNGDYVYWDGVKNTLVYVAPKGLLSDGRLIFHLADVQQLFVNELGIPLVKSSTHYSLNRYTAGIYVSAGGSDCGTLDPWPLINVTVVPVVAYSRLAFLSDIGGLNIQVGLNMNMSLNDTLILQLPSFSGTRQNLTVFGECADVASIECLPASSMIRLKLKHTCVDGVQVIDWNITNKFQRIFPSQINQVNSLSTSFIGWENIYMNTEMIPITDTPVIGFASTALHFGIPTAGYISNMTFKALMIIDLNASDTISLFLPSFSFPFEKVSLTGNIHRLWAIEWYYLFIFTFFCSV
jgi:hypothetical protein